VTSKFAKKSTSISMKLGIMLEVDETFTTVWLSRSSEVRVKVRRWPQSPIGTIFRSNPPRWPNKPGKNVRPYVHNQTQCNHKPNSGIC